MFQRAQRPVQPQQNEQKKGIGDTVKKSQNPDKQATGRRPWQTLSFNLNKIEAPKLLAEEGCW